MRIKSNLCQRGKVFAHVFDKNGKMLAGGINRLDKHFSPCTCNTHNIDTKVGSSDTCLATHAEVIAVTTAWKAGATYESLHTLWATRPPCKNCIKFLVVTNIQEIVVTPEFEDRDNSKEFWEKAGRQWSICEQV